VPGHQEAAARTSSRPAEFRHPRASTGTDISGSAPKLASQGGSHQSPHGVRLIAGGQDVFLLGDAARRVQFHFEPAARPSASATSFRTSGEGIGIAYLVSVEPQRRLLAQPLRHRRCRRLPVSTRTCLAICHPRPRWYFAQLLTASSRDTYVRLCAARPQRPRLAATAVGLRRRVQRPISSGE